MILAYPLLKLKTNTLCVETDSTNTTSKSRFIHTRSSQKVKMDSTSHKRKTEESGPKNTQQFSVPFVQPLYVYGLFLLTGQLYITGGLNGRDESLQDVYIVDMASGTVTHAPPMQVARASHTVTASSSALFVFGGVDSRSSEFSFTSCEMFTPHSNQ